jgi:hypothetical protein
MHADGSAARASGGAPSASATAHPRAAGAARNRSTKHESACRYPRLSLERVPSTEGFPHAGFRREASGKRHHVTEIKHESSRVARVIGRGRDETTPFYVHLVELGVIGAFVGLVIGIVFAVYYLA